jgi:hypothetical protein
VRSSAGKSVDFDGETYKIEELTADRCVGTGERACWCSPGMSNAVRVKKELWC